MSQPQSQGMSPEMEQLIKNGPPYPPQGASVGGVPTVGVDVPILSVFLALYLTSAITNITIFQRNRRRGHMFFFSALLVGFSMARVLTCTLRIVWACKPTDVSVSIAASIFTAAGILIIYIINILLSQRILRARRPELGWHWWFRMFFYTLYSLLFVAFAMIVVMTVYSFYTPDPTIHSEALWMQRGAITYLFLIAIAPLVILAIAFFLPRTSDEHFGKHSMETKGLILLAGCCLCTTIAGFRLGTTWEAPRAKDDPAWYDSRAAFYCFNFMLEITLIAIYVGSRIDHKFHVPDGSRKRKSYRMPEEAASSDEDTERSESVEKKDSNVGDNVA